jgi:hypothetical protein
MLDWTDGVVAALKNRNPTHMIGADEFAGNL